MAPSPTIPTSFVPKAPVKSSARFNRSGSNIFMTLALIILGVAIAGAGGVFLYQQYLNSVKATKMAALADARKAVDPVVVEEFVRFRERFRAAEDILDKHVAASHFFDILEEKTLANVRFTSFTFEHIADGSAKILLNGTAKSFNALAAQSSVFTDERRVKRAIFADIKVDPTGTVAFSLSAELDPALIAFTVKSQEERAAEATQPIPVAVPTAGATTTTP